MKVSPLSVKATKELRVSCGPCAVVLVFTASFIRVESYILVNLWRSVYLVFCTRVAVEEEEEEEGKNMVGL